MLSETPCAWLIKSRALSERFNVFLVGRLLRPPELDSRFFQKNVGAVGVRLPRQFVLRRVVRKLFQRRGRPIEKFTLPIKVRELLRLLHQGHPTFIGDEFAYLRGSVGRCFQLIQIRQGEVEMTVLSQPVDEVEVRLRRDNGTAWTENQTGQQTGSGRCDQAPAHLVLILHVMA